MYAIKSGGNAVGYADEINYIRLHSNGCYVLCDEADAEGFCVKLARETVDAETGDKLTRFEDTVYALSDGGLNGTEPVGAFEIASAAEVIADKDSEINDILTELETEAKV